MTALPLSNCAACCARTCDDDFITLPGIGGGRIGAIFMDGALGTAMVGYKVDGKLSWRFAFNAAAPVLPGFAKARAFAL